MFFVRINYNCANFEGKKTNEDGIFVQLHNEKAIDLCKTTSYNKAVPKGREQVSRLPRAAANPDYDLAGALAGGRVRQCSAPLPVTERWKKVWNGKWAAS